MEAYHRDLPNHFKLPRRINRLGELAYNLWWVWNPGAQKVFSRINRQLWEQVNHNPVAFLHTVERTDLNKAANDPAHLALYDETMEQFDQYVERKDSWFKQTYPRLAGEQIAYFSFEFGLHESLPVYAGGLGVLAGDHLKESSDLDLPLVGVGFIYNQGYFRQHITEDGWQEIGTHNLNFARAPIVPLVDEQGQPLTISVELPGRQVHARIWEVVVGRVSLYLLDTNLEINQPHDRQLTDRLYSNDLEIRISQEILLGMGGVRALRRLGHSPSAWHMNEGHSAFLALERVLEQVKAGKSYDEAVESVRKTNLFTTHTPVPAGNDQFPLWLIDKYFAHLWPELGLSRDQFVDLGHQAQSWGESYVMPVLALKLSEHRNAVSELHGDVSRRMWSYLWPDRKEGDIPISSITNGVHTATWMARRLRVLFDQYLGADWMTHVDDPAVWARIEEVPDEELWAVHYHLKRKLMLFINERTRYLWLSGRVQPSQVVAGGVLLDPTMLTIGFARRFATYKRGNLLLRDMDRLLRMINNASMPVQIIFAGKAHPADEPGKLVIQQVYRAVKDSRSGGRMAFLEDYDMNVARHLVQGVDVWLNTPRRPNEASGTSGMKAALNGVLNLSVLDGWWREGYNGRNGWSIGTEQEYPNPEAQDEADAASLYETLEKEVIPLYYNRADDDLPHAWIFHLRNAIRTLGPAFSTRRMVKEYLEDHYLPILTTSNNQITSKKPAAVKKGV